MQALVQSRSLNGSGCHVDTPRSHMSHVTCNSPQTPPPFPFNSEFLERTDTFSINVRGLLSFPILAYEYRECCNIRKKFVSISRHNCSFPRHVFLKIPCHLHFLPQASAVENADPPILFPRVSPTPTSSKSTGLPQLGRRFSTP